MLKAVTFNIHKFYDLFNLRYTLEPLRGFLREHNFDIVFLQEVRGVHPKGKRSDFSKDPLEFLADQVWSDFAYGKNAIYTGGHQGNAMLSKYPLLSWSNHDISNHSLERRSLLHGRVEVEGKELELFCTHLDLTQWGRQRQVIKIREIISKEVKGKSSIIFGGDFNDWNGKIKNSLQKIGLLSIEPFKTYPSKLPFLELDRVFYRNIVIVDQGAVTDKKARSLSDHIPLYCEFELR